MLTDAIASEGFKLVRNRWVLFWGVGFAAIGSLIAGLFQLSQIMAKVPPALRQTVPQDVSAAMLQRAWGTTPETLSWFVAMVLLMFATTVIFGGDYRWRTWSLLRPRNSRLNLFVGKLATVKLAILVSTVLLLLVGILMAVITGLANGSEIAWTFGAKPNFWLVFFSMFLVSFLHLMAVSGIAALATTATRSMLAGMLISLIIVVVQFGLQLGLAQQQGIPGFEQLIMVPGLAADVVRQHVGSVLINGQQVVPESLAQPAILSVLLWILVGFGGAAALILRQDLSKE